ncbi:MULTISPECIES: hypothetical protein [Actinoalloteichus]|uniref:Uncharacterized protein n=1 Tax=Actinoalloteichus fjordicus TaxID=1612552 RepID=A0AAC9LI72_9PSEU|nr:MULTISPECIES: hypothetical protein [Actinoalloteichus]APU16799.1 hypothetical protein UA74_23905 [Actinoalloteichus fjordicus]APU22864.1 hypothetical protein UA75_24410 [Actinoalloteichus sp. GBA129-24]
MTDFEVVPEALRNSVRFLQEAADSWASARDDLTGQELSDTGLGLLGSESGATRRYGEALTEAMSRLGEGSEILEAAATALKDVADDYESRDAEFYAQFDYLTNELP